MAKATTSDAIRRKTIRDMKNLKTYKPEYDPVINIYAEMREQYAHLTEEFVSGGYAYEIETTQGGQKKSPLTTTLEALRKDILLYSDRLCLNPKSFDTLDIPKPSKKQSALVLALREAREEADSG